jgi:hypothetical protein
VGSIKIRYKPKTKSRQSGVDVIITIFSDFAQFFWQKMAFFFKINVTGQFFAKTSSILSKKR